MRFAIGQFINVLSQPYTIITSSPLAQGGFPATNLRLTTGALKFQWRKAASVGQARYVTFDLNQIRNGGSSTANVSFVGWKRVGTPSTDEAGCTSNGSESLNTFVVTNVDYIYQDTLARSGDLMKLELCCDSDSGIKIQSMETKDWLQSDGTWGTEAFALATTGTLEFQVQSRADSGKHAVTLRVFLQGETAGAANASKIALYAAFDLIAVIGYDFPKRMAPKIYGSTTGAFGGEEVLLATMVPEQPSFYSAMTAAVYYRFVRLTMTVLADELITVQPWIGKFMLVQTVEPQQSARFGAKLEHNWPSRFGTKVVARATRNAYLARYTRTLRLTWRLHSGAWENDNQIREWLVRRSRSEQEDCIIIIPELEAGMVIFGGIGGPRAFSKNNPDYAGYSVLDSDELFITEDPFPVLAKGQSI